MLTAAANLAALAHIAYSLFVLVSTRVIAPAGFGRGLRGPLAARQPRLRCPERHAHAELLGAPFHLTSDTTPIIANL